MVLRQGLPRTFWVTNMSNGKGRRAARRSPTRRSDSTTPGQRLEEVTKLAASARQRCLGTNSTGTLTTHTVTSRGAEKAEHLANASETSSSSFLTATAAKAPLFIN